MNACAWETLGAAIAAGLIVGTIEYEGHRIAPEAKTFWAKVRAWWKGRP